MKQITPSVLSGSIKVIPSKSISHRALICAALAPGISSLKNIAFSDDIKATAQALCDMGFCEYDVVDNICVVSGGLHKECKEVIDCGESGSTLRFLLPLALDGKKHCFTGHGRLLRHPMDGYDKIFVRNHVLFEKNEQRIGNYRAGNMHCRGTYPRSLFPAFCSSSRPCSMIPEFILRPSRNHGRISILHRMYRATSRSEAVGWGTVSRYREGRGMSPMTWK